MQVRFKDGSLGVGVSSARGLGARERVFLSGWGVVHAVGSSFSDPPPKYRRRGLIRGNNTARDAPMAEPQSGPHAATAAER